MVRSTAERLKQALAELSIREKDLLAAIGIARVMIGKTEEAERELNDKVREKEEIEDVVRRLRRENEMLNLQAEFNYISTRPDAYCKLEASFVSEVETITQSYDDELKAANRDKRRIERENDELRKENDCLSDLITKKETTIAQLEGETVRYKGKIARFTDKNQELSRKLRLTEHKSKLLEFDLALVLRKVEKLEEDLKIIQNTDTNLPHGRHTSMVSKLPGILEDEETDVLSDQEDPASSGHTQCSYRREISLDFGYETSDEELFCLKKDLPGADNAKKRYSFIEVGGANVGGGKDMSAFLSRRCPCHPIWRPQSIVASFLRCRRVWAVVQNFYVLAYRYLHKLR